VDVCGDNGCCASTPLCSENVVCCADGASCDDGDACTDDACAGDTCCAHTPHVCEERPCFSVTCDSAEGCVYTNICICGDGDMDPGEQCDGEVFEAGAPTTHGPCRTNCTFCGDGEMNGDESCDDGNTDDNDGCSNNCTSGCGNGILNTGEQCDGEVFKPGAPAMHGPCRSDCTFCGDAAVNGSETCDDGDADNGDECRNNCTRCGDGNMDEGEECDGDAESPCAGTCTESCTCPVMGGCRITGGRTGATGGRDDGMFEDILRGQGGGQVGAPCGCIGCFTTPDPEDDLAFEHVQGQWQYDRKDKKGNFHAKEFNSLICGCSPTSPTCDGAGVISAGFNNPQNFQHGQLCNPGDRIVGPEPRHAPANIACFSGIGAWTSSNGRKDQEVAFRVEVEDRGEPSQGGNADDTCDVHRIRIWIPGPGEDVKLLADGACCTNAVPAGQAARDPNIDDGGILSHGNMQIHPMTPNSAQGRCPVPDGACQR
jgi:cysteine-rich repeat protein